MATQYINEFITAKLYTSQNSKYQTKYTAELKHTKLKDHKVISAFDKYILQNKVDLQVEKWDEKWTKEEEKLQKIWKKEAGVKEKLNKLKEAEDASIEAHGKLKDIENLLFFTLEIDDAVDWESIKSFKKFGEPRPKKPQAPKLNEYPREPHFFDEEYQAHVSFFEKLIPSLKRKKEREAEKKFQAAHRNWREEVKKVDQQNTRTEEQYVSELATWNQDALVWQNKEEAFYKNQKDTNFKIDQLKIDYQKKSPAAIVEYCDIVLNNSIYPDTFPKDYELEYNPENQILMIEYTLPSLEDIPTLKEVKYISTKDEFKETHLTENQVQKIYDTALYNVTLRTLHEIFEADVTDGVRAINFNGWVESINSATGNEERKCILSINSTKDEFLKINLAYIDPKACFKQFKGVGSSKLSTLTPIRPLMMISKEDKRFTDHYSVTGEIDESTNLATMDWEDFEHLIREIFEKEFNQSGGEVKITQASRDGGVDAVAFDPDPIRGGKIVIQAKRYTNTVGVSAVRDLFGTVMNEGASKGILVTTSDYGPDAYNFAQNKPLTLLNGSNLLFLLEKHGQKARIDVKEAKKTLK